MVEPEPLAEPLPQEKVQQQQEKEQPDAPDEKFLDLELCVRTVTPQYAAHLETAAESFLGMKTMKTFLD
eukprot:1699410-Prorocentrum_lima.AAC.1